MKIYVVLEENQYGAYPVKAYMNKNKAISFSDKQRKIRKEFFYSVYWVNLEGK
jgi:hypothetical protein